jgi:hypothetical protein
MTPRSTSKAPVNRTHSRRCATTWAGVAAVAPTFVSRQRLECARDRMGPGAEADLDPTALRGGLKTRRRRLTGTARYGPVRRVVWEP